MSDTLADLDAFWTTPFEVCPQDRDRQTRELIRYATMAANAHNTQPWLFEPTADGIVVHPDFRRRQPLSDPDDRELWISIGKALENLCISARRVGWHPDVEYLPADADGPCVRVTFTDGEPVTDDPLFEAITERHSNRLKYDRRPIPAEVITAIEEAGQEPDVRAMILTSEEDIEKIIAVTAKGFAWQRSSKAFRTELISWIRFSKKEIIAHRDGITSRAVGRPMIPEWLGYAFFNGLSLSGGEAREVAGRVRSSSAVLAVVSKQNDTRAWLGVGRSLERYKLTAVHHGVVNAHMNNNWQWDATREAAKRALGLTDEHVHVAIRLGYAPRRTPFSSRRPVEDVIGRP